MVRVPHVPPLWVSRGSFVPGLVDGGSWGADRGRNGAIASLSSWAADVYVLRKLPFSSFKLFFQ